jgi:protein TonB
VLRQVSPRYPSAARKSGAEGTAYVTVSLDARGRVQSSSISRSSGHSSLDHEALRTVKRWKFRPALSINGQPTRSQARVPVVFKLR